MKNLRFCVFFVGIITFLLSCSHEPNGSGVLDDANDLTDIPYNPTPYIIQKPAHFPEILIPEDNPMTKEGVQLGRKLFYDYILSGDSTQSCSSCHLPAGSFTDNKAVSKGIDGITGTRSSMSLLNIAYVKTGKDLATGNVKGLFWDGRSENLESQALLPVEDPIELHNTWANAVGKLKAHSQYPTDFRKAFGITNKSEITKELAAKALAQFERILISSGESKYDKFLNGQAFLTDEEEDGRIMFFDDATSLGVNLPDGQCFHCHGGITLTGSQFFNNGLDEMPDLNNFPDKGRGLISGNIEDNGKFRSPTLRNIALTAPYMHDGRFSNLEEVMNHYGTHGKPSPNKDPFINQIGFLIQGSNPVQYQNLSNEHQKSIIAFLHTLTDTTFINNPDIVSPF
jgi:cytochrome c peroxidase